MKSRAVISHKVTCQSDQGLIPTTFHVDGVEFFTNAEFVVWSMSSTLAAGNVSKLGDNKCIASGEHIKSTCIYG